MKASPLSPPSLPRPPRAGDSAARETWVQRHSLLCFMLGLVVLLLAVGHGYADSLALRCRIGENIRFAGERRIGVDVNRPVGGIYYSYRDANGCTYSCVLAPEVSYRPAPPLLGLYDEMIPATLMGLPDGSEGGMACELEPTGRVVAAAVGMYARVSGRPEDEVAEGKWAFEYLNLSFAELLPQGLPGDAVPQPAPKQWAPPTPHNLGTLRVEVEPPLWRCALALPFDYLVDPIVSAALSLLNLAVFLAVYVGVFAIVVVQQWLQMAGVDVQWVEPPF